MNKAKVLEFFDAEELLNDTPIHIIGCGAIGSHVAEQLARIGCVGIHLWDFDTVEPHNITNQMFTDESIGKEKVLATVNLISEINPDICLMDDACPVILHDKGWTNENLDGYVFLCVDNIDLRREIVLKNQYNPNCIALFDFRMRLTDAQHYMAMRDNEDDMKRLLGSMNFTHDEAKDATPKSACNTELSVITTVKVITALGVNNFMKAVMKLPTKYMILVDLNNLDLTYFPQ